MGFPTSPTNGQTVVVNNITYQYANTTNSWSRLVSTANVISANTVTASTHSGGLISVTGNITGNYFIGNGSQLTGVATGTPTQIVSGTSNVSVISSGGNVSVGVGGTGNIAVFATTGEYVTGVVSASGNIVSAANVTGGNILTGGLISATGTLSVTGATTLGTASTGNLSAGNVTTGGIVSAAGNVTGGNLLTGGLVSAAGTITGTSHLGSVVSVTANVTGGNLLTGGLISSTGNVVSAGNIIAGKIVAANDNIVINSTGSEGGQLVMAWAGINNITGQANSTWNLDTDAGNTFRLFYQNGAAATNVLLQASPTSNIVIFPQSAGVSATGNISAPYFIGNGSQLTGISGGGGGTPGGANTYVQFNDGGSFGGNAQFTYNKVTNTLTAGIISASNNGNGTNFQVGDDTYIGDINTADTMSVRGQQNAANGYIVFGNADATSKLGRAGSGPLTYAGAFSATGNVIGGNILTVGQISATGTITTAGSLNTTGFAVGNGAVSNVALGMFPTAGTKGDYAIRDYSTVFTSMYFDAGIGGTGGAAFQFRASNTFTQYANINSTGINTALAISATGNVTGGNLLTGGLISAASTVTGTSHLGAVVSVTGNVTAANVIINGTAAAGSGVLIVSGNIQTSTSNATANIGNASNYFNRLFAQATTALYADLAEVYKSDAQYPPGTVLVFGGNQEVTTSTESHDARIAGVVSTNPAHVMNSGMTSEFTVEVGLIGRVPCQVIGPISAGDRVVSSNRAGVAERLDMSKYQPGVIIGKALENYSSTDVGTIEVVVGRL